MTKKIDTPEVPATKSIIHFTTKESYGKKAHCGDDIATRLKAHFAKYETKDTKQKAFETLCFANGLNPSRWEHLNFGMQRMNLGNVLRGLVAKGEHTLEGL